MSTCKKKTRKLRGHVSHGHGLPVKRIRKDEHDIAPGEVHYLIEWKGCNEFDFVPSKVVNVNSPEMVIEF